MPAALERQRATPCTGSTGIERMLRAGMPANAPAGVGRRKPLAVGIGKQQTRCGTSIGRQHQPACWQQADAIRFTVQQANHAAKRA